MTTPAPVLNKLAISYPVPGTAQPLLASLPAQQSSPDDHERVIVALRFGEALEELVVRCRLQNTPEASPPLDSRFPLDLSHRRSPEAFLRGVLQKLLKLERGLLLSAREADDGVTPAPLPSVQVEIGQKIQAVLNAYEARDSGSQDLAPDLFTGPNGIDEAIHKWDTAWLISS